MVFHPIFWYTLFEKCDAYSKILHFSSFVKKHFNYNIKSFQCNNDGDTTIPNSCNTLKIMAFRQDFHALVPLNKMKNLTG